MSEEITSLHDAIASVLDNDSDDVLCASFVLSDAETPWVQIVPGTLNLYWPWEDDPSPVDRVRAATESLPTEIALETCDPGTFATFDVTDMFESSAEVWVRVVDELFRRLYDCPEDYEVDIEVYSIQTDEIPPLVPITRLEDSATECIGTFGDGQQFMAFVVDHPEFPTRSFSVLHRFDAEGGHLGTEARGVTTDHGGPVDRATLEGLLGELEEPKFADITVELFSTEIDGVEFGLVDGSYIDEETGEAYVFAVLMPNGIAFFPPWDGEHEIAEVEDE